MLHEPKVLVVLVLLLASVLVASVWLSLAAFTGSSQNAASIRAASVAFDVTPVGGTIDTTGLRPGDTRSGQIDVVNRQVGADFSLGFTGRGVGPLPPVLQLTVAQTAPVSRQLYQGTLSAAPTIALGRIDQGKSIRLAVTFVWPSGSRDPELQGQSVPLVLQWNATT